MDAMTTSADTLDALAAALGAVSAEVFDGRAAGALSDAETIEVLRAAGAVVRRAESILVAAAGVLDARCAAAPHADRVTTTYGCRTMTELVERATRVSGRRAGEILTAARAVAETVAPSSGERLPADLPAMRAALASGDVGVDGVVAVAVPLRRAPGGVAGVLAADEELAASARGEGVDAAPPACADQLRALAHVWAAYLDQDGAEPDESRALRARGVTLGVARDGVVPIRGNLLPEVAAQLTLGFDAQLNPKASGVRFVDSDDAEERIDALADHRTRAQKQHDALAAMLVAAAGSGALPTLGGAAPTLVVSVRERDLLEGRGVAHIDSVHEPVSLSAARHVGCTGVVQRVVSDDAGRIVSITTSDRIFSHWQRKAIALRDGGCIIPGCHVPASWCEMHHVEQHSRGGPTATDNGVALCWFHHRTIDTGGWKVRMRLGVPEIRGPAWWDPTGRWRPVTSSPTRMRDRLERGS